MGEGISKNKGGLKTMQRPDERPYEEKPDKGLEAIEAETAKINAQIKLDEARGIRKTPQELEIRESEVTQREEAVSQRETQVTENEEKNKKVKASCIDDILDIKNKKAQLAKDKKDTQAEIEEMKGVLPRLLEKLAIFIYETPPMSWDHPGQYPSISLEKREKLIKYFEPVMHAAGIKIYLKPDTDEYVPQSQRTDKAKEEAY
ncbi:MAG: hypothetical protein KKG95_08225 [Candidatus Omnitrophica bacterium]|nr:hypothetical protein [Candidatus Omnitrophota bacterium]